MAAKSKTLKGFAEGCRTVWNLARLGAGNNARCWCKAVDLCGLRGKGGGNAKVSRRRFERGLFGPVSVSSVEGEM